MSTTTTTAEYDYLFKFLLAGDIGSGRTRFLIRYVDGEYIGGYVSTIGVDFKLKTITSPESSKKIKMQIWDAAGRERFRQITSSYYRGAHGIFFMFDVTDRTSFQSVKRYFDDSNKYSIEHVQRLLVATKIDETDKRVVSYEEAKELADHLGIGYIETSSKNNINIDEAVTMLARSVEANWTQISAELPPRKPAAQSATAGQKTNNSRCIVM